MFLAGHPGAVVSLAAVPGRPGMLASLGKDGTVRFWDVIMQQRLATVPAEATAMVKTAQSPFLQERLSRNFGNLQAPRNTFSLLHVLPPLQMFH